ncbi:MAG: 6-bladed beta-propeller [Gemmatimonadetes bacterium]|nr:6-bladed beta-propeller [Gemmatimonadota bacterium]
MPGFAHCVLAAGLAGALFAGACDQGAGPAATVERTDSAGIRIVRNTGPDGALVWSFEKVLDLGGADEGPEAFHRVFPSSIGTDAAGRIYVLDAGNYSITVFDGDGSVVRTMGSRGGGPGEMRFPTDLAVRDDGAIAVWDFDKGGSVEFGPDGGVLPERKFEGALQRQIALTPIGVVGSFRTFSADGDAGQTRLMAIAGADTITFASQSNSSQPMVQFDCMAFAMAPLLTPDIVWAARGDRVIVSQGDGFDLAIHAGPRLDARWRRGFDPIPATVGHAAAELGTDSLRLRAGDMRCSAPATEAAERIGYAATVPPVKAIAIARDGQVWVQRRTATPGEVRVDILLDDGTYLGTLPAGAPFPAAFRGPDEIVVVEPDALDLPHVVVYRIERS